MTLTGTQEHECRPVRWTKLSNGAHMISFTAICVIKI